MASCLKIIILCFLFSFFSVANGEDILPQSDYSEYPETLLQKENITSNPLTTPQNIEFSKCCASFDMNSEKLFYLTISAINANNFEIEEIQSKMGYILFRAANKSFLAAISAENENRAMIKITPADNVYFFPYGVIYNIFYYIDLNKLEPLERI